MTQNPAAASATRAHLLVYDIPARTKVANPSSFLWRFGARINLSCWVIPDKNVAMLPIQSWKERGCTVELVRFDERDGATIIRLAREALVKELGDLRTKLEEQTLTIRSMLPEPGVVPSEERFKKVGDTASRSLRSAKKFLATAEECAVTFDLMGEIKPLLEGLHQSVRAKNELYYGWVGDMKKRISGQQSAKEVESDGATAVA
jgi:hypothetical protein